MLYLENYGPYAELLQNNRMIVDVNDINKSNWQLHFDSILNIMRDTIETEYCRTTFITIRFKEIDVDLSIIDYWFNLIMWYLFIVTDREIRPRHLFFDENMTKKTIKNYIDEFFIEENRTKLDTVKLNNIIDDCLYNFSFIDEFSWYLSNTINLEDFIDLMNENAEAYQIFHSDLSNVPLEEVSYISNTYLNRAIEIIKNSNHCLSNFFRAGEGVNPKQFKEVAINITTKPDGQGSVYPTIVNTNFITGGVNDVLSNFIESSTGRTAQIIVEGNVGTSGHFARLLGLNNSDTSLHEDPNYVCDSKNFQILTIKDKDMFNRLIDRYYRFSPNGIEYRLTRKDSHIIGQTIYLRSPMTCASLAKDGKVCYRCYGDLAYTNKDINIGKIAAELLSAILTQRMLSAKHLLESAMKVINWSKGFSDFLEVDYNLIKLQDTLNLTGYKLAIDPIDVDDENGDEDDINRFKNSDYMFYVNNFEIISPNGESVDIHTGEGDNIYLTAEMLELISTYGKEKDDKIVLDLDIKEIKESEVYLFAIQLLNNDLSKSLENVKSIIDSATIIKQHDRHSLLQLLLESLIECGLNLTSVHAEIILANQIRSTDDILLKPEWQYPNEEYNILTLKQALRTNPSVAISVSFEKISRMLYDPLTFRKRKPSIMDLFFMEKPQNYLTNDVEIKKETPMAKNKLKPLLTRKR